MARVASNVTIPNDSAWHAILSDADVVPGGVSAFIVAVREASAGSILVRCDEAHGAGINDGIPVLPKGGLPLQATSGRGLRNIYVKAVDGEATIDYGVTGI